MRNVLVRPYVFRELFAAMLERYYRQVCKAIFFKKREAIYFLGFFCLIKKLAVYFCLK
jgi:hypothetical protein